MQRFLRFSFTFLACLLAACQVEPTAPASPTPAFVTATLPPTAPAVTSTPLVVTPDAPAIQGVASTRINVRPGPGAIGEPLGMLDSGDIVEVLGQDPGRAWYQIVYPEGPDGIGWVNADYLKLDSDADVPVIGAGQDGENTASVTETVNVRAEPDSGSRSLGILPAQSPVTLSGQSGDGKWLQLEYPAAPDGKGWVAAAYVQAEDVNALPVISEDGRPVGTATPAATLAVPTFTLLPAPQDGDSAQSPAAQVAFSPGGARQFSFTGQVSAPEGDLEDWVTFTPYGASGAQVNMRFSLECTGRGELDVELLKDGQPVKASPNLACGVQEQALSLAAGQVYQLRFRVAGSPTSLQSVGYIITIQNGP
jgi:uncharacterized protein YraI